MKVIKSMTDAQWDIIETQYPAGTKYLRCYNAAEAPGELRIILRLPGGSEMRYVVRQNEDTSELLLIEKP